jgi:hypothetical protein
VAPYLISWHPVPVLPTQSQLDQGYIERRPYNNGNVNEGLMKDNVYIGASMHSYAMSILAANYGLNASFTRCFITNTEPADNIPDAVKPIFTTEKDPSYGKVPFVLGIGYRHPLDKQVGDANYKIKPGFDEINFWQ